jgi:Tfp pilus assembly protein PilV
MQTITEQSKSLYQKPAKSGFILLEVLVSVIILTIGLVAVLGAFTTSSKFGRTEII